MKPTAYTIDDLCRLTGYSRRTIRYYVAEGLVEPPAGRGRGGFYYDSHLQRLQQIRALQDRGWRISEIQRLPALAQVQAVPAPRRESWMRVSICPGVEIHVRRDVEERDKKAVESLVRIAGSLFEKEGAEK